ncbi:MAG: glycosyltransferase, partial [Gemmatimonadales bacterium]
MQTLRVPAAGGTSAVSPPVLDVVVPVHNEAATVEASVRRVRAFLDEALPWPAVVTIADNASTDATAAVADRLAASLHGVRVLHLGSK